MIRPCEYLDAYIDGTLVREVAEMFKVHLAGCSGCGAELRKQRELERLLTLAKDQFEAVPDSLRIRIECDLEDAAAGLSWRSGTLRYAPFAAAAALLLAMTLMWAQRAWQRSRTLTREITFPAPTAVERPLAPERALVELALFATEGRAPKSSSRLAWLTAPVFTEAETVIRIQPAPRFEKSDDEKESSGPDEDGPKTGRLRRFNAVSLESVQSLGMRKLDQTVIQPLAPPKKEDIPC